MTGDASILWPRRAGQVLRVIELNIEALFELVRERLSRRVVAVHRCVTDRAHGNVRGRELSEVTARTIFVAGKNRPCGVVVAMMTAGARNRRVL